MRWRMVLTSLPAFLFAASLHAFELKKVEKANEPLPSSKQHFCADLDHPTFISNRNKCRFVSFSSALDTEGTDYHYRERYGAASAATSEYSFQCAGSNEKKEVCLGTVECEVPLTDDCQALEQLRKLKPEDRVKADHPRISHWATAELSVACSAPQGGCGEVKPEACMAQEGEVHRKARVGVKAKTRRIGISDVKLAEPSGLGASK